MSFENDIISWATDGGTTGDPATTPENVRANLMSHVGSYANIWEDFNDIPVGAEVRGAQGPFFSPHDVEKYLTSGTLMLRDENGTAFINPIVHIYYHYDDVFDDYVFDVYIDGDTE